MKVDLVNKINIFVGKRNSGKSILMKHMMKQFKTSFRKIYLISPSEKINKFYGDIVKSECIYDEYNEKWMELLILNMTKTNEGLSQKSGTSVPKYKSLSSFVSKISITFFYNYKPFLSRTDIPHNDIFYDLLKFWKRMTIKCYILVLKCQIFVMNFYKINDYNKE